MRRKSAKQKIKLKIQKVLLDKARERDRKCVLNNMGVGNCGGITSADHIITRQISRTFAEMDNIVLLCWYHHFQWKPSNPTIYTKLIKEIISEPIFNYIHELAKQEVRYAEKDWLKIYEVLQETN